MSVKLFIPLLLGTTREGRYSEHVSKMILKHAKARLDIKLELFDVRDFNFPLTDEGQSIKGKNQKWKKAVEKADALIIVSPEYNHGYPGSLKMALDTLLPEYNHKAVALCGVSMGGFGGARVIEQLAGVVRRLGLVVTEKDLNISNVQMLFSKEGQLQGEFDLKMIDKFLDELVWLARSLKWGRENLISKKK
ncbi:NAD(P)H-dependent oxidoreductase [Patescibacteria group bacterium]|nr:NAD(P)H-dependent oxidoreductase [Patescibacteria group bacterium]